jgi:putative Mn2+ efflux pump MntP
MSNNLTLFGLLLGLDSLAIGTSLGGLMPEPGRRIRLALAFALCDGLASLLGSTARIESLRSGLEWCGWLGPVGLSGYGLYVLFLARRCQEMTSPSTSIGGAFCLPVCLSLDNLVAGTPTGIAGGAPAMVAALIFGLISGAMALCGLMCGATLGAHRGVGGWRLSGTLLILVAVGLVLKDSLF